jgi:hypothetical protein
MNRAIKNLVRGKQRSDARDLARPRYPMVLSQYDDRANYEAGTINQEVIKPLQPDGMLASWAGSTPPN